MTSKGDEFVRWRGKEDPNCIKNRATVYIIIRNKRLEGCNLEEKSTQTSKAASTYGRSLDAASIWLRCRRGGCSTGRVWTTGATGPGGSRRCAATRRVRAARTTGSSWTRRRSATRWIRTARATSASWPRRRRRSRGRAPRVGTTGGGTSPWASTHTGVVVRSGGFYVSATSNKRQSEVSQSTDNNNTGSGNSNDCSNSNAIVAVRRRQQYISSASWLKRRCACCNWLPGRL